MKKALAQSHWEDVLKHGLAVLKINPWDVATLTAMASAAEGIVPLYGGAEFSECQMLYLKTALEANSKDPEVNRLCGVALGKRRQFDQAIACWHRVEQARPDDDEPKRAIAALAVEKTITRFDETDPAKITRQRRSDPSQPQEELTAEERLQRRIAKDPQDIAAYAELSQVFLEANKFKEAEEVLRRAYEASDHNVDVGEKLADAQSRRLKFKLDQAEQRAGKIETEENKAEVKRCKKEYNQKLLEVWKHRAERYPNQLPFRLELGQQYMTLGITARRSRSFRSPETTRGARGSASCSWASASSGSSRNGWPWSTTRLPSRRFRTATPTTRRRRSTPRAGWPWTWER